VVNKLKISCDDQYLFSAGNDGLLWIMKIEDNPNRKRDREWLFSDEILVSKSDLKENFKIMSELRQRLEEIKSANENQQKMKDLTYSKKLTDTIEKFKIELNNLKDVSIHITYITLDLNGIEFGA
jgi:hypothetical protein